MPIPPYYVTFLRNYAVDASIGVHDFERAARQKLLVSVKLLQRTRDAATDAIDDVVDYDFIREEVRALFAARHFDLQETACAEILALCMRRKGVLGAVVQTEKPDVYPDSEGVGCRMADFESAELMSMNWLTHDV